MIFGNQKKYRKGVFMVTYILERGKPKYLIQKRKLHWTGFEFPKGGIEGSENKKEALRREIFEETGLLIKKIKNHHKKGRWIYNQPLKDRPGIIGQSWHLYSVQVEKGRVKLDKKEHYSSEWLPYKKARDKLTWGDQKESLDIVHKWLTK